MNYLKKSIIFAYITSNLVTFLYVSRETYKKYLKNKLKLHIINKMITIICFTDELNVSRETLRDA